MKSLKELIKDRLENIDKIEVVKKIGYNNARNGLETLDNFLNCKDILNFLHGCGKYDFVYYPEAFFKKLCEVLGIDKELIEKEMDKINKIIKEKNSYKDSYIYVNTNFVRQNQPLFVMAFMQGSLYIRPNIDELLFKSDKYVFGVIAKIAREHYKDNNGELPMWGKIRSYAYHHKDGKVYVFDPEGKLVDEKVNEIKVCLKVL
ncbi:hypothetical protein [Hippea sp. KM1]|uniref:hypothetical protein n=1 Tax=Hippea sp. KM1 TaxID=944481 RepID=UPI00046D65DD|nr:hypothetical protein [Hippea sp. KM1]